MAEEEDQWDDPSWAEENGLPPEEPVLGEGLSGEQTPGDLRSFPDDFKTFVTTTAEFHEMGPFPLGSVLTMNWTHETESTPALVAVMVTGCDHAENGIWLEVRLLGADTEWARKQAINLFSRKKLKLHCCFAPAIHRCGEEEGYHITEFGYWPPGRFKAAYVDRSKMTMMARYLEELKATGEREADDPTKATPERLAALRQRLLNTQRKGNVGSRTVSFRTGQQPQGILKRPREVPPSVKPERTTLVVSSESEASLLEKKKKSRKELGVGQALYAAVEQRQLLDRKAGADGRPSSSSKKKKKKKKEKRKKKKDSSSGSSSTSDGSSSDDLKPPLQRKAERKPGSVLKMLMDHVRLSLSDLSLGHSGEGGAASSVTSTARVQSYFQILVRPQLHNRPRDEKELFSLALGLDLLRQGKMEQVADLLAGRYIAVETAALEGSWDTAKWLEVSRLEDRGVANPEVLLAARKHQRTIDRASGRGSYGRGGEHYWDSGGYDASLWSGGGAGRGRGRGGRKGKDGKGKGKKGKAGKKGVNPVWWDDAPPKDGEKESGKKGDQAK